MSCRRVVLPGLLCVLIAGCGRRGTQAVERLAVPPFENLSDDLAAGWAGWALSEAVAAEVTGAPRLHPLRVTNAREAARSSATSVLRGNFAVSGGRIRLNLERRGLAGNRVGSRYSGQEAFPEGLLRLADAAARWIDPGARPFDTANVDALKAFAEGREADDTATAAAAFERSVSIDPDFGGAYVAWARSLLLRGDRVGLVAVLQKAEVRGEKLAELRRLDLELLRSAADNDRALRRKALVSLSRATPADAEVVRQLAAEDYAARRFDSAAGYYRKAAALNPLDQGAWNQLGYAEAGRRNLDGARSALEEYRRLAPKDANPLDSLGDVHYHLGRFREAERHYLDAYETDKTFLGGAELYKAARARLMTGDVAGANQIFQRLTASDPFANCRRAQWLYLTGKKAEAVAEMRRLTAPEVLPLAASQLAVWALLAGGREEAAPSSPFSRRLAVARDLVDGRFADAMPLLKEQSAAANPLGYDRVDVLLAWALIETGRVQEAAPLLEVYGVPPVGVDDPLLFLAFPRVFQLRAVVLAKQGKQAEAAKMLEVYRRLSQP